MAVAPDSTLERIVTGVASRSAVIYRAPRGPTPVASAQLAR